MKRPSFRFGLRTLLVVTTLIAIGMAFWGNILYKNYREKAAIESLRAMGAKIQKFEDHAVRVYLGGPTWDNEQVKLAIPDLKQLYKMRELDLVRVTFNDDGINPLSELLGLQEIYVFETSLTEAGIKRLGESVLPGTKINTTQPDGKHLAAGASDGKVRIWNQENFELMNTVEGDQERVYRVAFHPTEDKFVTGGERRSFNLR